MPDRFTPSFSEKPPEVPIVPVESLISGIDLSDISQLKEFIQNQGSKTDSDRMRQNQIEDAAGLPGTTEFAGILYSRLDRHPNPENQRMEEKLRRGFSDQVVVDLGSGENIMGLRTASLLGARGYIAVEKYWPDKLLENIKSIGSDPGKDPNMRTIPVAIAPEDMLTFLRRLPDESVSVMAVGIDEYILDSNQPGVSSYIQAVNDEINRVVSRTGVFIGYNSVISAGGKDFDFELAGADGNVCVVLRKAKQ